MPRVKVASIWKPRDGQPQHLQGRDGHHGEPAVAIRTVADQLKFMATCGAVPPGTYTVRSTNRHAIATKVEVAP